ncbi:MAG TPA: serine/threonine-protein kinase [Gemmatimonadaceae bacterium]|nr:serine/threonine-protein kinase [Gemmatimonadaceae bacterium]
MSTFEERLKFALSDAYEIGRELGGGGMSRVFVATETSLGRKIVIKVLSPALTADVDRGRFRREIMVAAQLQHPHIVTLLSAGEVDNLLYYTMPFISGESLKAALENGPLSVLEVVRVLYHVSEALEYAHGRGVVHRDIKPANVLRSGTYSLITDFGVAKALNAAMPNSGMTSTGMAVGTPAYMAPEQLAGDAAADHRVDIYALGLLAYELLYGTSPFASNTAQGILAAVLTQQPKPLAEVRPDVPASLSDLVMRCLSKEPENRPANATEVLDTLDMFATASGEIRTMEHRVPRSQRLTPTAVPRTTPTAVPATMASEVPVLPASGQTATSEVKTGPAAPSPVKTKTPHEELLYAETAPAPSYVYDDGYVPRKKSRSKFFVSTVAVLVLAAMGAFLFSQRSDNGPSDNAVATPQLGQLIPDSPSVQSSVPPVALSESARVAAATQTLDSQAIKDSIRKARRQAALKAAAADSARKALEARTARETNRARARAAVASLLADANARKSFMDGATHKGGLLGARRKGDLQTQIDALQPFLSRSGLSYEQFKSVVQESGIKLYDEFGRMLPAALQRFASGG